LAEYKFKNDTESFNGNLNITIQPGDVVKVEEKERYMTKIGDRPNEMKEIEAIVYEVTHNKKTHEIIEYKDLFERLDSDNDPHFIKIEEKPKKPMKPVKEDK
jgi:hypothetical protein